VITGNVVLMLGMATLLLGALAAMFGHIARDQDRLGRWLARRGVAERARLDAFRAIARDAAAHAPPVASYGARRGRPPTARQQRTWLGERAARHRRSSEWTSIWGGVATALAFVVGSGAVIGGFELGKAWVAIAGVIGAAVAAYAVNREALRRDRTNADRYEGTRAVLNGFAGRDDPIALEIASGKPEALVAFRSGGRTAGRRARGVAHGFSPGRRPPSPSSTVASRSCGAGRSNLARVMSRRSR
jgi:hypothetical protein